jgi:molybdopterin converting factor subunit 1
MGALTVNVLLFASYADAAGRAELEVAVPRGSTVSDVVAEVRRALVGGRSASEGIPAKPLVAVNEQYASYERVVHPGDEVALIPPVAGG